MSEKNKQVWKFPLTAPRCVFLMPFGAKVLCVQMQHDVPTIWALCEPERMSERRVFGIVGTGHSTDRRVDEYVGTVQVGSLVWHVFGYEFEGSEFDK